MEVDDLEVAADVAADAELSCRLCLICWLATSGFSGDGCAGIEEVDLC